MNENEMSLMTILRTTNSDLAERLKRLTVEVKQDKENLSEASQEYSNKYKDEINTMILVFVFLFTRYEAIKHAIIIIPLSDKIAI